MTKKVYEIEAVVKKTFRVKFTDPLSKDDAEEIFLANDTHQFDIVEESQIEDVIEIQDIQ